MSDALLELEGHAIEDDSDNLVDEITGPVELSHISPRLININSGPILNKAACRGLTKAGSHVDFYPDEGYENPAKLVCNSCPQQDDCLEIALTRNEELGIWGGASEKERRNIKNNYRRRRAAEAGESLGNFAIRMRHKYIKPADELGPFDSRKPKFTKIEADALCLTNERDLFEMLDAGRTDGYLSEMLFEAQNVCMNCINFRRGCSSIIAPENFATTVIGGVIQSRVNDDLDLPA